MLKIGKYINLTITLVIVGIIIQTYYRLFYATTDTMFVGFIFIGLLLAFIYYGLMLLWASRVLIYKVDKVSETLLLFILILAPIGFFYLKIN